jgi:hypothetical protein
MINTVYKALSELGLRFEKVVQNSFRTVFRLGVGLENGRADCFVEIREPDKQLIILTIWPVSIPDNKRKQIAEFITRINYNLILGAFVLDFDDGELRYKCNFVYDNTLPQSEDVFIRNLFTSFLMMDRYLPGIISIVYANIEPKIAFNQIEKITDPSMN